MLRYDRQTKPGLVALYDIRPGNGAGPFLQPRSPHEAFSTQSALQLATDAEIQPTNKHNYCTKTSESTASKQRASLPADTMPHNFLNRLRRFTFMISFGHLHLNEIIRVGAVIRLFLVTTRMHGHAQT